MNKSSSKDFDSNDYALLANTNDHWVNFSCNVMNKFLNTYGEEFNLIIYWENPTPGFYSIPYKILKDILTRDNSKNGEGKLWVFTIRDSHNLHLNGTSININVSKFLHIPSDEDLFAETIIIKSTPEGEKKLRTHISIERDSSFVRKIKQAYYLENPDIPCNVCGFSFIQEYGEFGRYYIEAHHKVPLSELNEAAEHDAGDFVFVCANCHRMLHRNVPALLSIDELKAKIRKSKRK